VPHTLAAKCGNKCECKLSGLLHIAQNPLHTFSRNFSSCQLDGENKPVRSPQQVGNKSL